MGYESLRLKMFIFFKYLCANNVGVYKSFILCLMDWPLGLYVDDILI